MTGCPLRFPRLNRTSSMKFVPDQMDVPAITAHGPGWVAVNGQPFDHHLLLTAQGLLQPWDCPALPLITPRSGDTSVKSRPVATRT